MIQLLSASALAFIAAIVFCLLSITTTQTKADGVPCQYEDYLGSYRILGGSAYSVTVVDNTAYVVNGNRLQLFDVSDLAEPILLGSYEVPGV